MELVIYRRLSVSHLLFLTKTNLFTFRNPKNVDNGERQSKRSVVDVFVRYPSQSVVDIDDVANKLNDGSNFPDVSITNFTFPFNQTDQVIILRQRNASLFWGLIIFCLVVVIIIIVIIFCNCCPGCYYYNDKSKQKGKLEDLETTFDSKRTEEGDITVLAVRNEKGENLKDAKFVEILKSAKNRIRSAISRSSSPGPQINAIGSSNVNDRSIQTIHSRLFTASRRPQIWGGNSVRPVQGNNEVLVLQEANDPYYDRSIVRSNLARNERMFYENEYVNRGYVESIHGDTVRNRRLTDSILVMQNQDRYRPNYPRVNVASVMGDGISSYRAMSLQAPPPLHGHINNYHNTELNGNENQNSSSPLQIESQDQTQMSLNNPGYQRTSTINQNSIMPGEGLQVNSLPCLKSLMNALNWLNLY